MSTSQSAIDPPDVSCMCAVRCKLSLASVLLSVGQWLARRAASWARDAHIRGASEDNKANARAKSVDIAGESGYPYYYFHRRFVLGLLGILPPACPPREAIACPVLFVYGAKKPGMFHSPSWERSLSARADGSKAVGLKCGHWVQVERSAEFNALMSEWLLSEAVGEALVRRPQVRANL